MKEATPLISDIVLVGGGHAHVHILKMAGMPPLKDTLEQNGIQITLISSTVLTPYSGMLPGLVAGHYTEDEIHLDLRRLCSFSGIRFIHASATGISYNDNGGGGWVQCSDGRPDIRYDTLSIDVGSSPHMPTDLMHHENQTQTTQIDTDNNGDEQIKKTPNSTDVTVTPVKPISRFSEKWNMICQRLQNSHVETYTPERPFTLVVVGGGAGGIELALSAQFALRNILLSKINMEPSQSNSEGERSADHRIKVILATRGEQLLPSHNEGVRRIFSRIFKERNIEIRYGAEAIGVNDPDDNNMEPSSSSSERKSLKLASGNDGTPIYFDECLWCTSAGASSWVSDKTPFGTTEDGFLRVRDTYELYSHRGVFAAGDCCHMVDNPRPKAGVFAVRAGPIIKENLISYLLNQPLTPHEPQKEFMALITTGDKYVVASRGNHALEGDFLWKLKDDIDRTWMKMYQVLPTMEEMEDIGDEGPTSNDNTCTLPRQKYVPLNLSKNGPEALAAFAEAPMRCGGCGAKVGSRTLTRVLDTVHKRRVARSKNEAQGAENIIVSKPKKIDPDDAAIVMLPKTGGGAMIQTIDFFRSFISDPFIFGKIAAVHALSDCHAMGAKAQTALALAVVQFAANEAITERTLVDMLSGASDILDADDCELAGGHTCEGAEQALGFAVSGFIDDPSKLLRKRGGKIGDKIVLTKAIGTGALFAADMRAKCHGQFVEEAIESMTTSNGPASRIAMEIIEERINLEDRGIHSCTDVTGFGLVGHMLEMLIANEDSDEKLDRTAASIDLHSIPFFKGAIEASGEDINSSLYRENSRSRRSVSNHEDAAKACPTKYPLLFDPQTAGGLLFFVSPDVCEDFVQRLNQDSNTRYGQIIGELTEYEDSSSSQDVCEIDGNCTPTSSRIYINY